MIRKELKIAVEGLDGMGKSTLIENIISHITDNYTVKLQTAGMCNTFGLFTGDRNGHLQINLLRQKALSEKNKYKRQATFYKIAKLVQEMYGFRLRIAASTGQPYWTVWDRSIISSIAYCEADDLHDYSDKYRGGFYDVAPDFLILYKPNITLMRERIKSRGLETNVVEDRANEYHKHVGAVMMDLATIKPHCLARSTCLILDPASPQKEQIKKVGEELAKIANVQD